MEAKEAEVARGIFFSKMLLRVCFFHKKVASRQDGNRSGPAPRCCAERHDSLARLLVPLFFCVLPHSHSTKMMHAANPLASASFPPSLT